MLQSTKDQSVMTQKLSIGSGARSSSARVKKTVASSPLTHAELMKKLSQNPRFKVVNEPGATFAIIGARPPKPVVVDDESR
jgi:hypothetical protein